MKVISGTFKVDFSREEYDERAKKDAIKMVDTPGLVWKLWAFNDERGEALGIYFFRDDNLAQVIFDAMDPRTWPKGCHDIELKIWDVQEELCKIMNMPL